MTIPMTRSTRTAPLLRPVAAVSGTIPARDLHATQRFYEEALGLQTRRPSADRLLVRLGHDHVYEVEVTDGPTKMPLLAHNGINARGDIVEQHARLVAAKEEYGIKKLTPPGLGHGTFGFYLNDLDGNWWEVNPAVDGRSEDFLDDLTDGPDMTPEQARERFQPAQDILQPAIDASAARAEGKWESKKSIVQSTCISHGTLESADLQESRRFYEEVLGLQVKQLTPASIMIGCGTDHRYVVVAPPGGKPNMIHSMRNRLLFASEQEVREAHAVLSSRPETTDVSEPVRHPDGRFAFELRDLDRNWWELYHDALGAPVRYFA